MFFLLLQLESSEESKILAQSPSRTSHQSLPRKVRSPVPGNDQSLPQEPIPLPSWIAFSGRPFWLIYRRRRNNQLFGFPETNGAEGWLLTTTQWRLIWNDAPRPHRPRRRFVTWRWMEKRSLSLPRPFCLRKHNSHPFLKSPLPPLADSQIIMQATKRQYALQELDGTPPPILIIPDLESKEKGQNLNKNL